MIKRSGDTAMLVPPTGKRGSRSQNLKQLIYQENNERWVMRMGKYEFWATISLYQIGYKSYPV